MLGGAKEICLAITDEFDTSTSVKSDVAGTDPAILPSLSCVL